MLDPLSKLAQSLAQVRRPPAAKGTATTNTPADKAPARAPGARTGRANAARGNLRDHIVSSLAALSEADLATGDRPVTVFVEQVLLHEWGPAFRESAQFRQTVKRVARSMRNSPQVRSELDALLLQLRSEAR